MGFASGFQVGSQAVERALKRRDEEQERERLKSAMGLTAQEVQQRQATPEELSRARAETQTLAAQDAEIFGLTPQEQAAYAPQMPVEGQRIGLSRYQVGQQTFDRMPSQAELEAARYGAAADIVAERDPIAAQRMRRELTLARREEELYPLQRQSLEQQTKLGGLQLTAAQQAQEKTTNFDTAFEEINKTEYKTPAERDAAVLSAVARFKGPEAAAQLQANYSTNERNNILTQGAKFDQTIKQARLKGPAAALKAIDDLNDSFTLEIDGFKVTQVNKDGSRVPFLEAKTAEEFALSVDSRIKEGGAFELAKFRQDEQSKNALIDYYKAKAKEANAAGSAAANQLSGVQVGYSRDANGKPIQVMSGLRFNKKSGQLESVQVQLEQNVVPASALDPKKIAEQAESIVGTPVDPTNKKGPQHTFATAQQAVVDQIFNQYLGTGASAGELDLSPAAVAKRMREEAEKAKKPSATSATPAPRQTGSMGLDTNRPRTDVNPVTGQPRETPPTVPNLVAAVNTGLDAAQERYKVYLQNKIANNQALTPDETLRARRFGLQ